MPREEGAGLLFAALIAALLGGPPTTPEKVRLPARMMTVGRGLDERLGALLQRRAHHPLPTVLVVPEPLDAAGREALRAAGCRLLQALGPRAHLALLEPRADLGLLKTLVVWAAPLEPVDHVDPRLWAGEAPSWARVDGGVKVLVTFYEGVTAEEAAAALAPFAPGARVHGPSGDWAATIDGALLPQLAAQDGIEWIEPGPDPMMPL